MTQKKSYIICKRVPNEDGVNYREKNTKPSDLSITMPGKYERAYAKFRAGVAPIKIETGRYEGIDVNERFCFNCRKNDMNIIEDEKHVLLECPEYADLRTIFFNSVCVQFGN